MEAAIVLPVLICFMTCILFFFRVLEIQQDVESALSYTARELAVYAHAENNIDSNSILELGTAKVLFTKQLKKFQTTGDFIIGGQLGVDLLQSSLEGKDIDLVAAYAVKLPISLFGKKSIFIEQRACSHKWIGWKVEKDADTEWVYVTETGTVYHTTLDCAYLDLSIQSVPKNTVNTLRNAYGKKYEKCELCAKNNQIGAFVYITNYGTCYHSSLNCSGLKRTVYRVKLSEVGDRKPCSKCGNIVGGK